MRVPPSEVAVLDLTAIEERIVGAKIERIEPRTIDGSEIVVHFQHRGTDDDAGFLVLPLTGVYFNDGGFSGR